MTPHFATGTTSVFISFIRGAEELLKSCFEELKTFHESHYLGETYIECFESGALSIESPLKSSMPLADILAFIGKCRELTTENLDELHAATARFIEFISTHEIHAL